MFFRISRVANANRKFSISSPVASAIIHIRCGSDTWYYTVIATAGTTSSTSVLRLEAKASIRPLEGTVLGRIFAILTAVPHPVATNFTIARRACRAAIGFFPVATGRKANNLQHRVQIVRTIGISSRRIIPDLGACRLAALGPDVVQVNQQALVLPAMGNRNMTPTAAQATNLVGMKGMQVGILGAAEALPALSIVNLVALLVVSLIWNFSESLWSILITYS